MGDLVVAQQVKNPIRIHEDTSLNPGLAQWVKDPALLWAAWELSHAIGAALKKSKRKRKKKEKKKMKCYIWRTQTVAGKEKQKIDQTEEETNGKMTDLNPSISIIMWNAYELYISIKKHRLPQWMFKTTVHKG